VIAVAKTAAVSELNFWLPHFCDQRYEFGRELKANVFPLFKFTVTERSCLTYLLEESVLETKVVQNATGHPWTFTFSLECLFWTECEAVGSLTHSKISPPTLGSSIDLPRPWRKCPRRQLVCLISDRRYLNRLMLHMPTSFCVIWHLGIAHCLKHHMGHSVLPFIFFHDRLSLSAKFKRPVLPETLAWTISIVLPVLPLKLPYHLKVAQ